MRREDTLVIRPLTLHLVGDLTQAMRLRVLDEDRLPVLVLPARGGIHEQEAQALEDDAACLFQSAG